MNHDDDTLSRRPAASTTQPAEIAAPDRAAARSSSTPHDVFNQMDADLIRVLEDLVVVLIDKGVITLADLPIPAQIKMLKRKSFRDHFTRVSSPDSEVVDSLDDSRFGMMR